MTIKKYREVYKSLPKKDMTNIFNSFSPRERRVFLKALPKDEKEKFIDDIRKQAVKDFWTHEQALIKEGKSTRDWTPEQVEDVLHISEKTGIMSINGEAAVDLNGKKYYGHHMLSVAENHEYAGDWRNVQALDYEEHYKYAHKGNTHTPTNAFYDPENKIDKPIDKSKLEKSQPVEKGKGYIDERKCIFKSDAEINDIYGKFGTINDGERLALKNIELAKSEKGTSTDLARAMDIVKKYSCKDFVQKYEINVEAIKWKNSRQNEVSHQVTDIQKDKEDDAKAFMMEMGLILQEKALSKEHRVLGEYMANGGNMILIQANKRITDDLVERLREEKISYFHISEGLEPKILVPDYNFNRVKQIENELLNNKDLNFEPKGIKQEHDYEFER